MEIRITLKSDEVKDIIKAHVLKEFPMDTTDHDIEVGEYFGDLKVEIFPKKPEKKEEENNHG